MSARIDSQQVLLNLLELKEVVLEAHGWQQEENERTYFALLHRKRGALLFSQEPQEWRDLYDKVRLEKEEWKPIRLRVFAKREGSKFFFLDESGEKLDLHGVSDIAQKIAETTLALLNRQGIASSPAKGRSIEAEVLKDLRFVRTFFFQEIERHAAWMGEIGREEAEDLLRKEPEGTYLLRHGDKTTKEMLEGLFRDYSSMMLFFVLTYTRGKGKISEKLILKDGGWFIYNDDPDLRHNPQNKFSSLDGLLLSIKEARTPYRGHPKR